MHKVRRLDVKVLEHAVIGIIAGVSVQLTPIIRMANDDIGRFP